mmetsp:Transcript_58817/g.141842  ORF Transcript_58817/g.141842 Transcript_58817/m.141842 type:complete len:216 (-) Transcript_58817:603-1250(-)
MSVHGLDGALNPTQLPHLHLGLDVVCEHHQHPQPKLLHGAVRSVCRHALHHRLYPTLNQRQALCRLVLPAHHLKPLERRLCHDARRHARPVRHRHQTGYVALEQGLVDLCYPRLLLLPLWCHQIPGECRLRQHGLDVHVYVRNASEGLHWLHRRRCGGRRGGRHLLPRSDVALLRQQRRSFRLLMRRVPDHDVGLGILRRRQRHLGARFGIARRR